MCRTKWCCCCRRSSQLIALARRAILRRVRQCVAAQNSRLDDEAEIPGLLNSHVEAGSTTPVTSKSKTDVSVKDSPHKQEGNK